MSTLAVCVCTQNPENDFTALNAVEVLPKAGGRVVGMVNIVTVKFDPTVSQQNM